jgi:Peptidogalycan biosysnthesis/recognition
VRIVASAADIPAALWDACFPPPLEGRWWYEALEASGLEDQFTFAYALLEQGGRPVGIAPLFLMTVPLGLAVPDWLKPILTVPARTLPFLADPLTLFVGSPCSDEGALGLLPGVDRRAALLALEDALEAEAARRDAPMIVWKDFPCEYEEDFRWLAGQRRLFRLTGFPGTLVDLPTSRKEDYLASLPARRRTELKRKLRRGAEKVDLDVEVQHHPDAKTLDEVFALFRQTYEKAPTKFEHLTRRFFAEIAAKDVSYFLILRERQSRDIVAFKLCFAVGKQEINKYIGIDYRRPREWMLYFRLWEAAVDWACKQGATSIQSGQTGYMPKLEVGHRLIPLTNYCRHRNRLLHAAFALFASRIGWKTLDDDLARFLKTHPEADVAGPQRK